MVTCIAVGCENDRESGRHLIHHDKGIAAKYNDSGCRVTRFWKEVAGSKLPVTGCLLQSKQTMAKAGRKKKGKY
jgi:hypothetical protein